MANDGNGTGSFYLPPDNVPRGPISDPVGEFTYPKRDDQRFAKGKNALNGPNAHTVAAMGLERESRNRELVRWANEQLANARPQVMKWRQQAQECDRFKNSKHFENEDLQVLRREKRPAAVFNAAQKWLRFLSGLETQALIEINFLPREIHSDPEGMGAELATKAFEWVIQTCHGDSERSRAFADMNRRGMGWTNVVLSRAKDIRGMVEIHRVDGMEMLWDANSEKPNLADAKWVARERQIPKREALVRWPRFSSLIETNIGTLPDSEKPGQSVLITEKEAVPTPDAPWPETKPGMVRVVEFQFIDEVSGVHFYDPLEDREDWMEEKEFERYKRNYEQAVPRMRAAAEANAIDLTPEQIAQLSILPDTIDLTTRVVRNQYKTMLIIGDQIVSADENDNIGPVTLPGLRFTFNCMTDEWDEEDKIWYGFFKVLIDPQRYATKFANMVMEILTRSSKGGVFVEEDSVTNPRQFEEEYAKTGSVSWVKPGTLAEGRVKEKAPATLPQGAIEMFNVCMQMLIEVTGIDPQTQMGMAAGDAPALTMRQRQNAGLLLIAKEFASLHRYRIDEAQTVFDFLRLIADDRWIRVGGQDASQSLQLVKDPLFLEYDVVLEEGTRDPNVRQQYWNDLLVLAPTLLRMGQWLPEFFDFSPFPASVKLKLKTAFAQQAKAKEELARKGLSESGRGKPVSEQEVQANIRKAQADALLTEAKAAKEVASLETDKQIEAFELMLEAQRVATEKRGQDIDAGKEIVAGVTDILAARENRLGEREKEERKSSERKEGSK